MRLQALLQGSCHTPDQMARRGSAPHLIVKVCLNTSIGRHLAKPSRMSMALTCTKWWQPLGARTYFCGSKPINGVFAASDVELTNACAMPVEFGVSNLRLFMVNFIAVLMVGLAPPKIVWPPLCQLNMLIGVRAQKYDKHLKCNIRCCHLIKKIEALKHLILKLKLDCINNDGHQQVSPSKMGPDLG